VKRIFFNSYNNYKLSLGNIFKHNCIHFISFWNWCA